MQTSEKMHLEFKHIYFRYIWKAKVLARIQCIFTAATQAWAPRPEPGKAKALRQLEKMLRWSKEKELLPAYLGSKWKKRNHSGCSRLRISLGEEPVEELLLSRTILGVFILYVSLSASLKKHLPHKNLPSHREAIIKRKDLPRVGMSRQEELFALSVFRPHD